jgi:hypothetical protein
MVALHSFASPLWGGGRSQATAQANAVGVQILKEFELSHTSTSTSTSTSNPSPPIVFFGGMKSDRGWLVASFLLLTFLGVSAASAKAASHYDACDQVIETEKGERIDMSIAESPMLFGRYAASKYICGADIPVLTEIFPRAIEAGGCAKGTELYQDFHELAVKFDQYPIRTLEELGLYNKGFTNLKRGTVLCKNLNEEIAEFLLEFSTVNKKQ